MKTGILVPCRQLSVRLPLKHLYPLYNSEPAIKLQVSRMQCTGLPVTLVIPPNDTLYIEWAGALGVDVSAITPTLPGNVLEEIVHAAKARRLDALVLTQGDSPLVCPRLVETLVSILEKDGFDMVFNLEPSGMRIKVMTTKAAEAWASRVASQVRNPFSAFCEEYNVKLTRLVGIRTKVKLSLDTYQDFQFLKKVVNHVGPDACHEDFIRAAEIISGDSHVRSLQPIPDPVIPLQSGPSGC